MDKKEYMTPLIEVVTIQNQYCILNSSPGTNDETSGGKSYAPRRGSKGIWDEEDDEEDDF